MEHSFDNLKSGDFNVKDRDSSGRPEKFEGGQLQELLDDDPTVTQGQLAEALHASQEAISRRSRAMVKKIICSVNGLHAS